MDFSARTALIADQFPEMRPIWETDRLRSPQDGMSGDEVYRLAWLAVMYGDLALAETVLQALFDAPKTRGLAAFSFAILAIAREKADLALSWAERCVELTFEPGNRRDSYMAQLAAMREHGDVRNIVGIFYDKYRSEFLLYLLLSKPLPSEVQSYCFAFSRCNRLILNMRDPVAFVDAEIGVNGHCLWTSILLGHHRWLTVDYLRSDAYYDLARTISRSQHLLPFHVDCGVLTWIPRDTAKAFLLNPGAVPPRPGFVENFELHHRPDLESARGEIVLVTGCDERYLKFLQRVVASLLDIAGQHPTRRFHLHTHVTNCSARSASVLSLLHQAILDLAPNLHLTFSTSGPDIQERAYYTFVRYLCAEKLQAEFDIHPLILDIDCELNDHFVAALDQLGKFDIGLRMFNFDKVTRRQFAGEPWSIGAHPTYCRNTPNGRALIRLIGDFVRTAYDPALETNWCIDQCAIARAFDLISTADSNLQVLNFAETIPFYHLPEEFGSKEEYAAELMTSLNPELQQLFQVLG